MLQFRRESSGGGVAHREQQRAFTLFLHLKTENVHDSQAKVREYGLVIHFLPLLLSSHAQLMHPG